MSFIGIVVAALRSLMSHGIHWIRVDRREKFSPNDMYYAYHMLLQQIGEDRSKDNVREALITLDKWAATEFTHPDILRCFEAIAACNMDQALAKVIHAVAMELNPTTFAG